VDDKGCNQHGKTVEIEASNLTFLWESRLTILIMSMLQIETEKRYIELPPKNWTGGEGALRPTFLSEEVWYNARHETSA
jgi:hypothetical protein